MELAKDCPKTTTFTLLDFNPSLCQAAYPSLPENVVLHRFDLLNDFRHHPEWTNHFDLIQERLLLNAFTPEDWRRVLKNYYNVLKPGGYLQMWETDLRRNETWNYGHWFHEASAWGFEMSRERGVKLGIIEDIPEFLEDAGFALVIKEPHWVDFTYQPTEPEPYPDTANLYYTSTARAMAARPYELGRVSKEDWEKFDAGIKDEFRLADKLKLGLQAWVFVAQVCAHHDGIF
jgi:SAM-dependent methyltransferase